MQAVGTFAARGGNQGSKFKPVAQNDPTKQRREGAKLRGSPP